MRDRSLGMSRTQPSLLLTTVVVRDPVPPHLTVVSVTDGQAQDGAVVWEGGGLAGVGGEFWRFGGWGPGAICLSCRVLQEPYRPLCALLPKAV